MRYVMILLGTILVLSVSSGCAMTGASFSTTTTQAPRLSPEQRLQTVIIRTKASIAQAKMNLELSLKQKSELQERMSKLKRKRKDLRSSFQKLIRRASLAIKRAEDNLAEGTQILKEAREELKRLKQTR